MTISEERRLERSEDPLVALHYQLTRARRDGRLDAIVLADEAGLVVAGAGGWAVCEELAAYAPLIVQGLWGEPTREEDRGSHAAALRTKVDVHPVNVEGLTVLLCARGGDDRASVMKQAANGVARILMRAA